MKISTRRIVVLRTVVKYLKLWETEFFPFTSTSSSFGPSQLHLIPVGVFMWENFSLFSVGAVFSATGAISSNSYPGDPAGQTNITYFIQGEAICYSQIDVNPITHKDARERL